MAPLLRDGGRLLQVIKIPKNRSKSSVLRKIEEAGFIVEDVIEPQKQETYIIARKLGGEEAEIENESAGFDYENYIDEDGVEYDSDVEIGTTEIDITDMVFDGEEN
jgi:hypothetical protein